MDEYKELHESLHKFELIDNSRSLGILTEPFTGLQYFSLCS